jgi:hypothetical protein
MWLGLLFSLFSIAVNLREFESEQLRYGTQPDYSYFGATYREKAAQCLLLGQYTRCGPYVIETLVHHFAAEYTRRRDMNNESWLILSTTVHLASMPTIIIIHTPFNLRHSHTSKRIVPPLP